VAALLPTKLQNESCHTDTVYNFSIHFEMQITWNARTTFHIELIYLPMLVSTTEH